MTTSGPGGGHLPRVNLDVYQSYQACVHCVGNQPKTRFQPRQSTSYQQRPNSNLAKIMKSSVVQMVLC